MMKFLYRIYSKFSNPTKYNLIEEIKRSGFILNAESVAEQFMSGEPLIKYRYKDHELFINNEDSALYHLCNSTQKIEKLVDSIHLTDSHIALDIGANAGLFTYFFKKKYPHAYVYLFEPDERLTPVIKQNLRDFGDYEILQLAVSEKDNEEVDFFINPQSAQTNSIIKSAVTAVVKEDTIVSKKIKTITIDTFCKEKRVHKVDVIKIDIQGGELGALQSADRTLSSTRVLLTEVSFFVNDSFDLLNFIKKYYKNCDAVNDVYMGADLKFYN